MSVSGADLSPLPDKNIHQNDRQLQALAVYDLKRPCAEELTQQPQATEKHNRGNINAAKLRWDHAADQRQQRVNKRMQTRVDLTNHWVEGKADIKDAEPTNDDVHNKDEVQDRNGEIESLDDWEQCGDEQRVFPELKVLRPADGAKPLKIRG